MSLALQWEACVRTRSRAAACQACVDTCPVQAVTLDGPRASVAVDLGKCTSCGLCQAVCPTEAFSGALDTSAIVEHGGPKLSCAPDACLGALSVEDVVALAVRHGALRLEHSACTQSSAVHEALAQRLDEARDVLDALGHKATIAVVLSAHAAPKPKPEPEPEVPKETVTSRRAFFRQFLPAARLDEAAKNVLALAPTGNGQLDPQRLREQPLTARRQRLLAALSNRPRPERAPVMQAKAVSFTSAKALDTSTCTACMQCVRACPTSALTSSRLNNELRFDLSRCVKCGTCHDVCEPRAITLSPEVNLLPLLQPEVTLLGKLPVKQCGECGGLFKYDGGDVLCPTCRGLDDEAREMHGVPPRVLS